MEGEDQPEHEDFGQTLASAGVNQGPYLMVPFIGSNTVRSASGRVVDIVLNPLRAFSGETVSDARATLPVVSAVSFRATHFDTINDVKITALMPMRGPALLIINNVINCCKTICPKVRSTMAWMNSKPFSRNRRSEGMIMVHLKKLFLKVKTTTCAAIMMLVCAGELHTQMTECQKLNTLLQP